MLFYVDVLCVLGTLGLLQQFGQLAHPQSSCYQGGWSFFCQHPAGRDGCAWIRLVAQSVELAKLHHPARCWGQFEEEVRALWPSLPELKWYRDTFLQSTCWIVCSRYPSKHPMWIDNPLSEPSPKTSKARPAREIFCDHCSTTSIWIGPPDFCFRLSYLDTNDAWRFSLRFCWIVVQVIVKRRWGACSNRCLRESPRPVPGSASQPEKVCLFFSAPFVQQLLTCKNSVLQLWAPFPVWYSLFFRFTSLRWALFRSSCCICSRFVAGVGFHIVWVDGVGCRCAWLYSSLSPVWRCGIAWAFFDGLRWREGFGRAGCQVPCVVYIAYFVFAAASKGRVACFACLLCHLYRLVVPPTPPLETVEQACWVALGCVLCL